MGVDKVKPKVWFQSSYRLTKLRNSVGLIRMGVGDLHFNHDAGI